MSPADRLRAVGAKMKSLLTSAKNPRAMAMMAAGLSLVVVTAVASWYLMATAYGEKKYVNLDQALSALAHEDDSQAVRIAAMYLPWTELPVARRWIPPYVFGMVNARRADRLWGERGRQQHLLAARYLEEAASHDMPESRRELALFELGRNQYLAGQPVRALPNLLGVTLTGGELSTEANRLLALSFVESPQPNWQEALRHNDIYLADEDLTPEDRALGEILRGRGEYELGETAKAFKTLDAIPEESRHRAEAMFWQAYGLMRRDGETRLDALRQASDLLSKCILRDNWAGRWSPQALLLRSRCRRELAEREGSLEDLAQIDRLYEGTVPQQAATFDRATLLLEMKRDTEALAAFRTFFESLPNLDRLNNPWLRADDIRHGFLQAYDIWMRNQDYPRASDLAMLADRVVGAGEAGRLAEDAYAAWRKIEQEQLPVLPYDEFQQRQTGLIQRDRLMAEFYQRLAKKQSATRDHPELLWKAAERYRMAEDYAEALRYYTRYLETFDKPRRPQAYLAIAECRLALGEPSEALSVLRETAELPGADVARSKSPLAAARAYLMLGKPAEAEASLLSILDGDGLTPESIEWRDALVQYARMLYEGERFDAAAIRFEEVLARYPQIEQCREVRYLLAESYRRTAEQLDAVPVLDESDANGQKLRQDVQRNYESALRTYVEVIDEQSQREADRRIFPVERRMLRNALYARGGALFALAQYEEAVAAYLAAVHHDQDTPEVLDALLQISDCYRRLNRPVEARGTLLQARLVLQRLPADARFADTTSYSRDEWSQLLEALIAL